MCSSQGSHLACFAAASWCSCSTAVCRLSSKRCGPCSLSLSVVPVSRCAVRRQRFPLRPLEPQSLTRTEGALRPTLCAGGVPARHPHQDALRVRAFPLGGPSAAEVRDRLQRCIAAQEPVCSWGLLFWAVLCRALCSTVQGRPAEGARAARVEFSLITFDLHGVREGSVWQEAGDAAPHPGHLQHGRDSGSDRDGGRGAGGGRRAGGGHRASLLPAR